MLVSLPESLIREVVCEWLDLKSITRLDSAFCARDLRQDFLNTLVSQTVSCADLRIKEAIFWMLLRGVCALKLHLGGVGSWWENDELVSHFFTNSAHVIRYIEVKTHTNKTIDVIEAACCNLVEFHCDLIRAEQLSNLMAHNSNLEVLSVHIYQETLETLADFVGVSLPCLTSLSMGIHQRCNATLTGSLIACAKLLQKLSVHHYDPFRSAIVITSLCPHLRSLRLLQVELFEDSMTSIVQNCPLIVNLSLESCRMLNDSLVLIIATHLHQLRNMNLTWCDVTDVGLQHLADHYADRLEILQLETCPYTTRAAQDKLRQHCTALCRFHYVGSVYSCTGLVQLIQEHKVTVLKMAHQFDDAFIFSIVTECDSIEIVDLRQCGELTTFGLTELSKKWPNLHTVVVRKAMLHGVCEIAKGVPHLTVACDASVYEFDLMNMPL